MAPSWRNEIGKLRLAEIIDDEKRFAVLARQQQIVSLPAVLAAEHEICIGNYDRLAIRNDRLRACLIE